MFLSAISVNNMMLKDFVHYATSDMISKLDHASSLKTTMPDLQISDVLIGIGTIIMANTVVNSNAIISKYCTKQSTVTISHDSKMGDYNFIATQSTIGNLQMGNRNFVGINASIDFITFFLQKMHALRRLTHGRNFLYKIYEYYFQFWLIIITLMLNL